MKSITSSFFCILELRRTRKTSNFGHGREIGAIRIVDTFPVEKISILIKQKVVWNRFTEEVFFSISKHCKQF